MFDCYQQPAILARLSALRRPVVWPRLLSLLLPGPLPKSQPKEIRISDDRDEKRHPFSVTLKHAMIKQTNGRVKVELSKKKVKRSEKKKPKKKKRKLSYLPETKSTGWGARDFTCFSSFKV